MCSRWRRISACAALSASSLSSARSRQVACSACCSPLTAFGSSSGGSCGSCLDDAPGLRVVVQERARHVGPAGDGGHGDRRLVFDHAVDGFAHPLHAGVGAGLPGGQGAAGLVGRSCRRGGGLLHSISLILYAAMWLIVDGLGQRGGAGRRPTRCGRSSPVAGGSPGPGLAGAGRGLPGPSPGRRWRGRWARRPGEGSRRWCRRGLVRR